MINVLGGFNCIGMWEVLKEIKVLCLMGGVDIDFLDVIFMLFNVMIKVLCVMGGIDIKVFENVNVVIKVFCFMGGLDNKVLFIVNR